MTRSDQTEDSFLGGRLTVRQPRNGYRAGVDPVLLAAAVPARSGEMVLELGCGAGVASLCLARRVEGIQATAVELQEDYASLARQNAAANRIVLDVRTADIAALPKDLREQSFDHVLANPPYFTAGAGTASNTAHRETAMREATPLAIWLDTAARRLRDGGRLTLIQSADRLPDVIRAADARLGEIEIFPLQSRVGRSASRVIVSARKGARGPFKLLPPMVLHDGAAHDGDRDSYSETASAILRDGKPWPWTYR